MLCIFEFFIGSRFRLRASLHSSDGVTNLSRDGNNNDNAGASGVGGGSSNSIGGGSISSVGSSSGATDLCHDDTNKDNADSVYTTAARHGISTIIEACNVKVFHAMLESTDGSNAHKIVMNHRQDVPTARTCTQRAQSHLLGTPSGHLLRTAGV